MKLSARSLDCQLVALILAIDPVMVGLDELTAQKLKEFAERWEAHAAAPGERTANHQPRGSRSRATRPPWAVIADQARRSSEPSRGTSSPCGQNSRQRGGGSESDKTPDNYRIHAAKAGAMPHHLKCCPRKAAGGSLLRARLALARAAAAGGESVHVSITCRRELSWCIEPAHVDPFAGTATMGTHGVCDGASVGSVGHRS